MHPALASSLRRLVRPTRRPQRELISVVVPFYNVEPYFAACLNSIIRQSYRRLQIILVDDGSQDRSFEIARSYRRWDRRITIVRQANRGLGAARNAGLRSARGRYICFVDSDDTLPRDALSIMVRTLERTGSDFVVGGLRRFARGEPARTPPWVTQVHHEKRLRITLDQHPDILRNVFAWNKLFVREFFSRVVGEFPEGVRYEDQEPTARAYVHGTFDVLSANVYNWRKRHDGSSLTQQKTDPNDLADRLVVKGRVSRIIAEGASQPVFESWLAKALGFDLRPYMEQVPRTDREFWQKLRQGVLKFAELATVEVWRQVALVDRYPSLCIVHDRREDLIAFLTRRDEYGWCFPAVVEGSEVRLDPAYLREMSYVPAPAMLAFAPQDIRLIAKMTYWKWVGSRLEITGHAYLSSVPSGPGEVQIQLVAVSARGRAIPLATVGHVDQRIDQEANDAWNTHRGAGFRATLDTAELAVAARRRSLEWTIEVQVRCSDVARTGPLRSWDVRGPAAVVPVADADPRGRWVATLDAAYGLRLRYRTHSQVLVDSVEIEDDQVVLALAPGRQIAGVQAVDDSQRRTVVARPERPAGPGGASVFRLKLPNLQPDATSSTRCAWRMVTTESKPRRLALTTSNRDSVAGAPHQRVRCAVSPAGTIVIRQTAWAAMVEEVQLTETQLVLIGRTSAPPAAPLAAFLVSDSGIIELSSVQQTGGNFRAVFDLASDQPSKRESYNLFFTRTSGEVAVRRWGRVSRDLLARMPLEDQTARTAVTCMRSKEGAFRVRFRQPLMPDERGRLAQRRLQQAVFAQSTSLREAVLFESFNGKSITDSPRALCEELRDRHLGLELFWTVDDLTRPVPKGTTPLLRYSRRWMEMLHSARYLVNNSNFPHYFRKQPEQTYIQTWHGTPLKRIGNDVPSANLSLPYRQLMTRESGWWDVLLAQNDFAASVLAKAFDFDKTVLNEGYPRNDLLTRAPATLRDTVRERLQLSPDTLAVLYAPTWRDSVRTAQGYSLVEYLSPAAVSNAFGDRARVLLRGHANTAHQTRREGRGVVVVTTYPEIDELFLAADVLVTDYSSVMFDFCVTGKPMIFLTPDFAEYRDKTRGFYFDLASAAPGPLCTTSSEVVAQLRDLTALQSKYQERYAQFRRTFAPRDDGSASSRVVDRIWGARS